MFTDLLKRTSSLLDPGSESLACPNWIATSIPAGIPYFAAGLYSKDSATLRNFAGAG